MLGQVALRTESLSIMLVCYRYHNSIADWVDKSKDFYFLTIWRLSVQVQGNNRADFS